MAKRERPRITEGPTYLIGTGCGELRVTVSGGGNGGPPLEVFSRLGKSGQCANAQNEALGRAISIGLQWGVPIEEYLSTLENIKCPSPCLFPEEDKCLSCPDGIALAIRRYLSGIQKIS